MKKLPKDFKPSDRTYNNLRKHGCLPEFVDYELDNFTAYFLDKGDEWDATPKEDRTEKLRSLAFKESWQMTCQVWMRRQWKGKAGREWEYTIRHNRSDGGSMTFETKPDVTPKPQNKRSYRIQRSPIEEQMLRDAGQLD